MLERALQQRRLLDEFGLVAAQLLEMLLAAMKEAQHAQERLTIVAAIMAKMMR